MPEPVASASTRELVHDDRRIAQAEGRFVRQVELVARLAGRGDDTALANELLRQMRLALALMRRSRQLRSRCIDGSRRAEAALGAKSEQIGELTQALELANIMLSRPDGRIVFWGAGMRRLYGWTAEEALGLSSHELLATEFPEPLSAIDAALRRDGQWSGELLDRARDGREVRVAAHWTLRRAEGDRPPVVVVVSNDITERKRAEERIRHLAHHDDLTGLPNRALLRDRLGQALALARRDGGRVAVLLVDLDDFKDVNDTLGHPAGDALLRGIAERLGGAARGSDTLARLGGDEFAFVQVGVREPADAAALARKVLGALKEPFDLGGHEVHAAASLGVALFPDDGGDPDELLKNADLALYAAKQAGRGTWRFFRPAMHERAKELAALDRDLRRALERDEFVLHYQPMVGAERLGLHALEALLRWNHPERGLVAPGEFLPAAERGRLIVPLTFWVLAEAVRQAAAWRAEGLGDVCVAANLATAALDADGLVEHVTEQLRAEGLPAGALTVEVTEGAVAGDSKMVVVLEALRRTGVRVAIDDFGAGYSSLARLRDLPLDLLKIDRAFLAAPGVRGDALLHAITGLAQSLELPTVVEGVETVEQLGLLRRAGASYAQGFLLARPMPAARVPAWLATWNEGRPHEPRTYGGEQRTGLTPGSLRDRPRKQPNERRADAGAGSTTRSDGGPGLRGPTVSASGSRLTDGTHLRRLARSRSGHGG